MPSTSVLLQRSLWVSLELCALCWPFLLCTGLLGERMHSLSFGTTSIRKTCKSPL